MRIVHVITRLIIGGAQENTLLSCEGQHDRGHEVTLITGPPLGPEGSLMERAIDYGYRVEVLDELRRAVLPFKDYTAYRALVRRFRELKPEIVHTHSSKAGILARWAAHRAGVGAIIHTIHGLSFTASTSAAVNSVYRWLERRTAPITTRIVCVADAMRDQSLAAHIGTREQYVTVYSGMETGPFVHPPVMREQVRRELGVEPQHVAVGTIARLFHLKGHEDLLEIAPELCARYPELRFVWVGEGVLRERLENRMRELNLRDRFILTGLVNPRQIPQLVNAMDVLVHPSRREGLARAIVQGQLARLPVVAYDVDGNREGMIDGQTGFVIRPFDKGELASGLSVLLDDAQLRLEMGAKGRAFAIERFDSGVMIEGLERLYEKAVALL